MLRSLISGFVIGLLVASAPSCGRQCTAANCLGCCNELGQCATGVAESACGANGDDCSACAGGQSCSAGQCIGGATGGGTTGGGGGGGVTGGGNGTGGGGMLDDRSRLFVTSTSFQANFGGVSGADALCQNAATAANKGGTWKAFVSSTTETAIARMVEVGPWYQERSDGSFVLTYNNKANLGTTALSLIYVDEQGRGSGSSTFDPTYWTGMTATNQVGPTCAGWTVTSGSSALVGKDGTTGGSDSCSSLNALLCLEQSRLPRPAPLPTTRKRLFVTSTSFQANFGGVSGADALCQNAATAANKGGTWKAFVSSTTETAIARMAEVGPWYQERSDGSFVRTYNNKANLGTTALSLIYVDEQGRGSASSTFDPTYWTGLTATNQVGATCAGWTVTSGSSALVGKDGSTGGSDSCSSQNALLCLEQ
ncbi:MAG: DUF1554 domain-containing protein [Archangium sp.]|nr:DUF1554 domain-containing protein [Archangium sp.]